MRGLLLAIGMVQSKCPIRIGVGRDGSLFSDRFSGWYKTAVKSLEGNLHGGCYNDANPSPITSVMVVIASGAQKSRVDLVFSILKREGWNRDSVDVQPWLQYPHKPPLPAR